MARTNASVTACFSAAMGIKPAEAKEIGNLAEQYNTGDIAADYASAVEDIVAQQKQLMSALQSAYTKAAMSPKAAELWNSLNSWLPMDPTKVVVVDSVSDLPSELQASVEESGGKVQGFVVGGRAYLIADNIKPKDAKAVLLHEVGAHIGLENLLTAAEYRRLSMKINEWADRNDNSLESRLAKQAVVRVANAGTPDADVTAEKIAYFIEEAVKAGVEPSAAKEAGVVANWLNTLMSAAKKALQKLGLFNADNLTAQDIVDLAYGAAYLEMGGDARLESNSEGTANASQEGRAQERSARSQHGFVRAIKERSARYEDDLRALGVSGGPELKAFEGAEPLGNLGRYVSFVGKGSDGVSWLFALHPRLAPVIEAAEKEYSKDGLLELLESVSAHHAYYDPSDNSFGSVTVTDATEFGKGAVEFYLQSGAIERTDQKYGDDSTVYRLKGVSRNQLADFYAQLHAYVKLTGDASKIVWDRETGAAANKKSGSLKFSIAANPQTLKDADAALDRSTKLIQRVFDKAPAPAQDALTNIGAAVKKFLPAWLTNHQLLQQYGEKLTSLQKHIGVTELMRTERTAMAQRAHNIAVQWNKLPKDVKQRLDKVMYDATMKRIDPAEKFGEGVNSHLKPTDQAAYDELKSRYNALGKEGTAVYIAARDELRQQWDDRFKAYNDAVIKAYEGQMADAMANNDTARWEELKAEADNHIKQHGTVLKELRRGPYFPLMRFGEYLAIGKSADFVALEKKLEELTGKERREAEAKLEEMKKDRKHYIVSAHEDQAAAKRALKQYKDQYAEAYDTLTNQYIQGVTRTSQHHLATMIESVTAGMDSENASAAKQALTNMYMQSLPEMHALRREAQRIGVEGASTDMLRAFAASSETNSFYSSRLKYGQDLSATLYEVKDQAARNTDLQYIHREMEKRLALSMTYTRTPIQDAVSATTWLYQLGVSPAALAINMTQPWLVSVPVLAGKFGGYGRVMSAMTKATADTMAMMKAMRLKDGTFDPWSSIGDDVLKNILTSDRERAMVRELLKRGILDDGAQNDNAALASGSNMNFHKFNRVMGWATQQVEMMNRTSTALAAFRLAYNGSNYDAAVKAAYDATMDTQFDYSTEGSARIMREGGGVPLAKLVFQFRRFQQGMLYLLVDQARKAYKGDKQAMASLAYITASSALSAGALGLPFIGSAFAIANMFIDDDDPKGDAETQFRNWLFDMTGDKGVADVMAKGLPAMFGADLSKRIGMSDVAAVFPMARYDGKTGRDDVQETLFNAAGPSAGLAAKLWQGMLDFEAGNWSKGVEQITPKAVGDVVKAGRYATEGMTDTSGTRTGTELDALDIALRGLGITPTKESDYYEGTRAAKNIETAVNAAKSRVRLEFNKGLQSGDLSDARAAIAEFNAKHPQAKITPKQEQQWRKEVREKGKQADAGSGVKLGGKYDEAARFATGR